MPTLARGTALLDAANARKASGHAVELDIARAEASVHAARRKLAEADGAVAEDREVLEDAILKQLQDEREPASLEDENIVVDAEDEALFQQIYDGEKESSDEELQLSA